MTSVKMAAIFSAVASSSVRLTATMPPNAETGSQRSAASQASASVGGDGDAARVGVLDDDDGGFGELGDALEGGVGVVEVVVGQFLALHLPGGGDPGPRAGGVEGGVLVRVLAVAQRLAQRAGDGEARREIPAPPVAANQAAMAAS